MEADVPPATLQRLLERLEAVGLDEKDALIYAHLCVQGPTKASEVAAAARVNRTEAYRSLDNLMRRGFVTASLDRPTLYEATPPEKVFDDALAAHASKRHQLERARDVALDALRDMRSRAPAGPLRSSYKILQGRPAIYAAVDAMLRRARVSQWMVSTYFAAANANEANSLFQSTLQRAKEGLAMRLLVRDTPGVHERLRPALENPQVEMRYLDPIGPLRFTIVDEREILIWLVTDAAASLDARDDTAMWTNAPDFVYAQELLYESLWKSARPVDATGRAAHSIPLSEQRTGKHP